MYVRMQRQTDRSNASLTHRMDNGSTATEAAAAKLQATTKMAWLVTKLVVNLLT